MSSHDEMETCRKCHVLHGDGPGHVCVEDMTDTQLNQVLNEAGINFDAAKRNLLNKLASEVVRLTKELSAEKMRGRLLSNCSEAAESALAAERDKVRRLEDIKQAAFDLMRGPRYGGTDEYRSPLQPPGGIDHACTVCVSQPIGTHTFVCAFCRLRLALGLTGEEPR